MFSANLSPILSKRQGVFVDEQHSFEASLRRLATSKECNPWFISSEDIILRSHEVIASFMKIENSIITQL